MIRGLGRSEVLCGGVSYNAYDRPAYDDVTRPYLALTRLLYDYRYGLARQLDPGGLLLHGGTAEDRALVAREIHGARTGGLDDRVGLDFRQIGAGGEPLLSDMGQATVFIPEPQALTPDEQAYLFYRLSPSGPPKPTLLGAPDLGRLVEEAPRTLMDKLVSRLFAGEYDVGTEA